MNIKKHIPNAITCGNLVCGCFGIMMTFSNRLDMAFYFVITAAILDFFDGFAARMLNVSSPIGKDLDSLADMVTFGVLPGFVMYRMLFLAKGFHFSDVYTGNPESGNDWFTLSPIAFLIPVFSALRLAKFNNDPRQTDGFIGLATPSNTLLISSLGYIFYNTFGVSSLATHAFLPSFYVNHNWVAQLLSNTYLLTGLTILMSFLLVAELPMFALKFKNFGWKDNKIRYILLISALILLILFQLSATPFIIFLYLLLSIIHNIITKKKQTTT